MCEKTWKKRDFMFTFHLDVKTMFWHVVKQHTHTKRMKNEVADVHSMNWLNSMEFE